MRNDCLVARVNDLEAMEGVCACGRRVLVLVVVVVVGRGLAPAAGVCGRAM